MRRTHNHCGERNLQRGDQAYASMQNQDSVFGKRSFLQQPQEEKVGDIMAKASALRVKTSTSSLLSPLFRAPLHAARSSQYTDDIYLTAKLSHMLPLRLILIVPGGMDKFFFGVAEIL